MSEQQSADHADQSVAELEMGRGNRSADTSAPLLPGIAEKISTTGEPATPKKLTAEEQMALYENSLKEEDWGHQPC